MFRKSNLAYLFVALGVSLACNVSVLSQTGAPVSGIVEMVGADGKKTPVAGARVEVYRLDVKGRMPEGKTDKNGDFRFVQFPYGGEFALVVSCANCAPIVFQPVKAGQEKLVITVAPGDGKRWTEAEARANIQSAPTGGEDGGGETEAAKNARAEIEKKNAEITAKNEKIKAGDAVAYKANTEGYEALKAKPPNYDLALTKFNEGIEAVPDYVGSTPIMLNGKMEALRGKAFATYQEGFRLTDADAKKAKFAEANKFYDDSLAAFQQAMAVFKSASAAATPDEQKKREAVIVSLHRTATETHRLKAGLDQSKVTDANALITEFVSIATDPADKVTGSMAIGDIMRRTGDFNKAIDAYRQVLVVKPDHTEAMGWLGLSLFGQGVAVENKDMQQEGMNYMQKYIDMSPVAETDTASIKELKNSIKDALTYLKAEKMTPQKITTAPKSTPKKKN